MRPSNLLFRWPGRVACGILVLVSAVAVGSAQTQQRDHPFDDPRIPPRQLDWRAFSDADAGARLQFDGGNQKPKLCAMTITVLRDSANGEAVLARIPEPVASLTLFEAGFERVGNLMTSNDVRAFVRVRIERMTDRTPLAVERLYMPYG